MAGYIVVSVEETQNTNQHGRNSTMEWFTAEYFNTAGETTRTLEAQAKNLKGAITRSRNSHSFLMTHGEDSESVTCKITMETSSETQTITLT
jgi:hypothetical protein